MSHSLLPPSSAQKWVNCTGWLAMTKELRTNQESEASRIGTKVHDLCATLLNTGKPSDSIIYSDEEMECAKKYVDYCADLMHTYDLSVCHIEQHLKMPSISDHNAGTPDFVLINRKRGIIHVVDYKHGMGIVEPYWNWQLLNYLIGVSDTHNLNLNDYACTLTIVQPRAYHKFGTIRSWCPSDLDIATAKFKLTESATEALSYSPKCNAGTHCRYCEALFDCPSAIQKGMSIFDTITFAQGLDLSDSAISLQYELVTEALNLLTNVKTSLESQMIERLKKGKNIPNYRMEPKSGNLEWSVSDEEAIIYGELMGINIRKASSPITPTQAKKLGLDVESLTSRKTSVKLERFDLSNAKRIF